MHYSFSTLWGSNEYRATEQYRPYANNIEAKAHRDFIYGQLRAEGLKPRRSVLRGQLRQYWSFGVPCGEACDVYNIDLA